MNCSLQESFTRIYQTRRIAEWKALYNVLYYLLWILNLLYELYFSCVLDDSLSSLIFRHVCFTCRVPYTSSAMSTIVCADVHVYMSCWYCVTLDYISAHSLHLCLHQTGQYTRWIYRLSVNILFVTKTILLLPGCWSTTNKTLYDQLLFKYFQKEQHWDQILSCHKFFQSFLIAYSCIPYNIVSTLYRMQIPSLSVYLWLNIASNCVCRGLKKSPSIHASWLWNVYTYFYKNNFIGSSSLRFDRII